MVVPGKRPSAVTRALATVLLTACLLLPAGAWGQEPEETLGFARRLAEMGQSAAAAVEFERFLFKYPHHPAAAEARTDLAATWLALKRPDRAMEALAAQKLEPTHPQAGRSLILFAQALQASGQLEEAIEVLRRVGSEEAFAPQIRDRASYRLGWLFLDASRWPEAEKAFAKVSLQGPLGPRAAFLAKEALSGAGLERKSPLWAGVLAGLLPGLGQACLGRWLDAAWAAGLTLGSGGLAWLALAGGHWIGGAMAVGLALAFYGGNIYNAVNQAHWFNRAKEDDFRLRLKRTAESLPGG